MRWLIFNMDIKRLLPAITIAFTNSFGATLIIPILPLYAVDRLDGTIFQAVLLSASYYAAKFVAAPILGRLADRYGRRPLLIISQAGTVFAFVLFIFALPLGEILDGISVSFGIRGGLIMLYLARVFDGATGGNTNIAQAYIADVSLPENRAQALGWLAAAVGVGFVFGPTVGGLLAGQFGLLAPFVVGVVITTIALILAIWLLKESLPATQHLSTAAPGFHQHQPFRNPTFMRVLIIGFLGTLSFASLAPTFALYADQVLFPDITDPARVSRNVGLIFTLLSISIALTQAVLIGPLVARWGEAKLIAMGQLIYIITCFIIPLVTNPFIFVTVVLPLSFAYGISGPSLHALITRLGGVHAQGQLLGSYQSAQSLAFLFGPIWAGYVFQYISPQAIWWVSAIILAPTFPLALGLMRRPLPDLATEVE